GEKYQIKEIAIDRWNASQLMTDLEADGFEVVGFGQGYGSMSAPSKQLETMLINGDFQHPNNPVLNWMCANTVVEIDAAGNTKPSKKK
ncbi:terminase TerL endonuclease subunit, partial [Acinetobacter sp. ULE_I001]